MTVLETGLFNMAWLMIAVPLVVAALLLVLRNVRLVQRLVVREPRQGMLDIDLVHEMEGCVSRAHVLMSSNSSR